MTVNRWSTTAASNATADSTINAREGMAPSQVNDALRGIMAAVAKWRDDLSGNLVTGGTSSAYTLTSNQGFASLTDGLYVRCRLHVANLAGATLNVDSTGAKPIATLFGRTIRQSALAVGRVQGFTYDSTDDKWIADGAPDIGVVTGEIKPYAGSTAPAGYVLASGRTIGNASSGGTERANADTEDLFTLLWNSHANTELPIQDSAGSPTTRGASAAADFAANRRLTLPDYRGRSPFGKDDMGGTAANRITSAGSGIAGTTLGASGGAQSVTIGQANIPNYTLPDTFAISGSQTGGLARNLVVSFITDRGGGGGSYVSNVTWSDTTLSLTGSVTSGGSGTPLNNMSPALITNYIIKL